jgi:hypothetical protein
MNNLRKYRLRFYGRKNNSLGIPTPMVEIVEAENYEKARLKLYDKYEHITIKVVTLISERGYESEIYKTR